MQKKLLFFIGACLLIMLAACSSPEEDEVLDYHNDFVDYTNPKLEEVDQLFGKMDAAETDEEAYDIEKDELTPIVEDIKDYVDEQDPEEDETKAYHELRSSWANSHYEAIEKQNEAYETFLDGSDEEADELFEEADEIMAEANAYDDQATEKWNEIMDKYDFEEEDE